MLTHRFQMMISPEEYAAIEEWRWAQRIRSTAEAMRQLVKIGLAASTKEAS